MVNEIARSFLLFLRDGRNSAYFFIICAWWTELRALFHYFCAMEILARTFLLFVRGRRCLRALSRYFCAINGGARSFLLFLRDGRNSAYLFAICLW